MPTSVIMPKLEMSQESAILREWLAAEGERVEKGAPLFVVETDKVTVDVEAPASGVLAAISARIAASVATVSRVCSPHVPQFRYVTPSSTRNCAFTSFQ